MPAVSCGSQVTSVRRTSSRVIFVNKLQKNYNKSNMVSCEYRDGPLMKIIWRVFCRLAERQTGLAFFFCLTTGSRQSSSLTLANQSSRAHKSMHAHFSQTPSTHYFKILQMLALKYRLKIQIYTRWWILFMYGA